MHPWKKDTFSLWFTTLGCCALCYAQSSNWTSLPFLPSSWPLAVKGPYLNSWQTGNPSGLPLPLSVPAFWPAWDDVISKCSFCRSLKYSSLFNYSRQCGFASLWSITFLTRSWVVLSHCHLTPCLPIKLPSALQLRELVSHSPPGQSMSTQHSSAP